MSSSFDERSKLPGKAQAESQSGAEELSRSEAAAGARRCAPDRCGTQPGSASAASQGRCSSNTDPLSSHVSLSGRPECTVSGGIDWLEWSALVSWDEWKFQELINQLEKEKQNLQSGNKNNAWLDLSDNAHLEVSRTGLNAGGSRGQHFDYRVECRDIRIGIAKRNDPDSPQPNLRVLVSGKACLLRGAWQCYDFVHDIVDKLGGTVLDEKLSRADACLDIAGLSVVELQDAVEDRAFISRSRSVTTHKNLVTDIWSGITAGKKPLRLVIYDKPLELHRRDDSLYAQTLIQRRWGGTMPESATRVEFQVSREALKNHGISSPADLREKLGAMFAKLGTDWFRITTQRVKSRTKNQSRAETLPLWSAIIEAGEVFFGLPAADLRPIDRQKIKPNRALRSGRGFIASALIQLGVTWKSYPEFLDKAVSALLHIGLEPEHWLEDQQSFLAKTERSFDFGF